jgi:hypothetical protein
MKQLLAGLLAAMSLLISMSLTECTDSKQDTASRPPGSSPAPAPALALHVRLPHSIVYEGNPLPLHIRLMSPLGRREAHLAARAREEGKAVSRPLHHYLDGIPVDWPDRLMLTLVRVQPDGRRETVVAPGAWRQWRATPQDAASTILRIGDPFVEWRVPIEAVQLAPGRYVLKAQWDGTDAVDAAWLDADGLLRAPEVALQVRAAGSATERAKHAQRRAQEDFQAGRYRQAREQGQEALRLDPEGVLDPERIETYLTIARAALAVGDADSAAEAYRMLLRRLPPPEGSDLTVAVEQWLARISDPLPGA